jgi:hypothetical protein
MAISNNFRMLMEDMKRIPIVTEDKSERKERREKRREERRSGRFEDTTKDFNLNSFMSALNSLKNSIVSQIVSCDNSIANPDLGNKQNAEKYKGIFTKQLGKVAVLLGQAQNKKDTGEGRKLESGTKDQSIIDSFRKQYQQVLDDFTKTSEEYAVNSGKEFDEYVSKIDFAELEKPLSAAGKSFLEARMLSKQITAEIKAILASESGSTGDKKEGDKTQSVNTSGIKVAKTIKSGTTPTGEDAEIAKKIFALICEKWKESKTLTATVAWKKSAFCSPGSLILGPNRKKCVAAIKAAYGISDSSGDLTQELVDKLSASEVVKESFDFRSIPTSSKLLSFNDFLSAKSTFNEEVNMDALKKALGGSSDGKSKSGSSDKKVTWESPFKNKEEGDAFRKWVNDKHSDWAKENKLDVSGSHTNSFVKKAWDKFKDEYKPGENKSDSKVDPGKASENAAEIEKLMTSASDSIVELFSNAEFWRDYKGKFNDDEEKAKVGFNDWWGNNILRTKLKPAKQKLETLPEDSDEKSTCKKMYDTIVGLKSTIDNKIIGETDNDTATWKMYLLNGEAKSYKVDTDF